MPSLRATTSSGSFFSAIGAPKLAMPVGGAARAIVECNRAGIKTRQTARRSHGYSGPFAPDLTWCRGHPMSVLLPKGGSMPTRRVGMRDSAAHKFSAILLRPVRQIITATK